MHEEQTTDIRTRLLETAAALIADGNPKFSISMLCQKAGVEREVFRAHFSGRNALMAALDEAAAAPSGTASQSVESDVAHRPVADAAPEQVLEISPASTIAPVQSGGVMPDAWLERRLRVFERALTALEARADATQREQAATIARLEERVRLLMGEAAVNGALLEEELAGEAQSLRVANGGTVTMRTMLRPDLEAAISAAPALEPDIDAAPHEAVAEDPEVAEALARQAALMLPLDAPPQEKSVPREEMAELLKCARQVAQSMRDAEKPKARPRKWWRLHWLLLGCVSLVALFICAGLLLGEPARALQAWSAPLPSGNGIIHRQVSGDAFARMVARADHGDARAQAGLALAYLRGDRLAADPRVAMNWAGQAAKAGNPMAQYLMGTLYHQGGGQGGDVKADPGLAFRWFAASARQGNIKAMHNLAIAYAEGLGTPKDAAKAAHWFARAAEHGYVDSAFDLAVLYERGDGVAQNPVLALKWYQVAAMAGDHPSQLRADFLRHQLGPRQAAQADAQVRAFERLMPLAAANTLPAF